MKIFTWSLICLLSIAQLFAQEQETITLTCELEACTTAPALYTFNGVQFVKVQIGNAVDERSYVFEVPKTDMPKFYYVGDGKNMQYVLLGTEPEVTMRGSCQNLKDLAIVNSPVNKTYNEVKEQILEHKRETNNLMRKARAMQSRLSEEELQEINDDVQALDAAKLAFLDSLKQHEPFFSKYAALDTYLAYDLAENKDEFLNEVDYFARTYYQFVDFEDPVYENSPWVYESFRMYTNTLSSVGLSHNAFVQYMERTLSKIPKESDTYRMALSGVITILRQKKHSGYPHFGQQFIDQYRDKLPQATFELHSHLQSIKDLEIGGTAPDFTQQTPEGEDLSLSDLRGKVVLLDFWASWCGPCRRENPNVVKVYEKYKDEGFEIIGISLDRSRERWLKAIEQDGLTWKHVSDLKYWNNAVAKQYNVRSIPHTILLDEEGKIIARNLRGGRLEQALAEIFE